MGRNLMACGMKYDTGTCRDQRKKPRRSWKWRWTQTYALEVQRRLRGQVMTFTVAPENPRTQRRKRWLKRGTLERNPGSAPGRRHCFRLFDSLDGDPSSVRKKQLEFSERAWEFTQSL